MHLGRRAAAAARPLSVRAVAMVLFVLGLAAATLALFTMVLINPDDSRFLVFCPPTDAVVGDLRGASGLLLVSAATQALAATLAVLVPRRALTVLACALGWRTGYHANAVIHRIVDCRGIFYYWLFLAVETAALSAGSGIALFGEE